MGLEARVLLGLNGRGSQTGRSSYGRTEPLPDALRCALVLVEARAGMLGVRSRPLGLVRAGRCAD